MPCRAGCAKPCPRWCENSNPSICPSSPSKSRGRWASTSARSPSILEGITCAACVWLNEQHLRRQPGVTHVEINYATRRALVRWDPERTSLSRILKAIAEIGYRAHPFDPKKAEEVAQRERRSMLWRVFVAGFASMQVMMYAIPTYLAGEGDMPADIERLLHWASLVLTLPAVFYSCGPFLPTPGAT